MIGTMYFIPREKVRLAEEIFTAIDSITLNYTDIHPEQMFMYIYNVKKEVMQYTESSNINTVFEGTTGKGHVSTCVLFGITPKGYYEPSQTPRTMPVFPRNGPRSRVSSMARRNTSNKSSLIRLLPIISCCLE